MSSWSFTDWLQVIDTFVLGGISIKVLLDSNNPRKVAKKLFDALNHGETIQQQFEAWKKSLEESKKWVNPIDQVRSSKYYIEYLHSNEFKELQETWKLKQKTK